ncbi:hypothetical protein [Arthrobacter sp.]|uniref:hypothetical protein n=1 Tax=Arthrobacter sp. TaxID=1667 RepID=UPI0028112D64|nr:hypothetical protein [Arthrobacter sp.]
MNAPLKVVAIIGSPTDPDQLLRSGLGEASLEEELERVSQRDVAVRLVSWLPSRDIPEGVVVGTPQRAPLVDRLLARIGAGKLQRVLQRYPAGRLLNSLGPLDQSRVFWRAVRENKSALSVLDAADVLIAVDLSAVRTAWITSRRNPSVDAYYGLASTLKVFATRFAHTTSS